MKELKHLIFIGLFVITTGVVFALPSNDSVWARVQQWRIEKGKNTYTRDYYLCYIANARVKEVQTDWSHNGFWVHVPEMFRHGYYCVGENLARGFSSTESMLNAWLLSGTHRINLEWNYTHSCVVCSNNYCVQMFGIYR